MRWIIIGISRVVLVLLGICLALAMLEIWFRIRFPDPSPRLVSYGSQLDDKYGVSFIAGAEGWNTSLRGEYSTYVIINSKGLRDVERDYHKEPSVIRILVLGDSMTAALQVPLEDTFPKILEEQLDLAFPESVFEVINAGVVGYGTSNELLFFSGEGYKYEPDWVVLAFFTGNDIMNNVSPPFFELNGDVLEELSVGYSSTRLLAPWQRPGGFLRKTRNYLYTHSRLYSVSIELLVYTAIERWPRLAQMLVNAGLVEVAHPTINLGNIHVTWNPPEEAWTMTQALILELKRRVEAHGAQLVVTILPDESEVDRERWQRILEEYPELRRKQAQVSQSPTRLIEQFLQEQAIDYIQCTPALRSHAHVSEDPLYYRYDGHFTPAGHRQVGQCIAGYFITEIER